jgi:hypothetical protein
LGACCPLRFVSYHELNLSDIFLNLNCLNRTETPCHQGRYLQRVSVSPISHCGDPSISP